MCVKDNIIKIHKWCKFFFRDLNNEDNLDGEWRTCHPFWVVYWFWNIDSIPNKSMKDLAVIYYDNYTWCVSRERRAVNEVELFKATEYPCDYDIALEKLIKIEDL